MILTVTIKAPASMVPAHAIMVGRDPVAVEVCGSLKIREYVHINHFQFRGVIFDKPTYYV